MFFTVIAFTVMAANAPACATFAPTSDVAGVYSSSFDGTLWGGQKVHIDGDLKIATAGDALQITSKTTTTPVAAAPGPCGSVATSDQAMQSKLLAYNNGIALANGAPSSITAGATWKSSVRVQVGPTQIVDLPVTVTFVKTDGSATLLQATGTGAGTLLSFGSPFNLEYRGAASFSGGHLAKAQSEVSEAVQAGPESQTMKTSYRVERKS